MLEAYRKALPSERQVLKHATADRTDTALLCKLMQRLGLLGRPVIMGVAIGQDQAADQTGMTGGKDLHDANTAVVGDDVDLIELHGAAEGGQHRRLGIEREILVGAGTRCAVSE